MNGSMEELFIILMEEHQPPRHYADGSRIKPPHDFGGGGVPLSYWLEVEERAPLIGRFPSRAGTLGLFEPFGLWLLPLGLHVTLPRAFFNVGEI